MMGASAFSKTSAMILSAMVRRVAWMRDFRMPFMVSPLSGFEVPFEGSEVELEAVGERDGLAVGNVLG